MFGVEVEFEGGFGLLPGVLPPLLLVILFGPEFGAALDIDPVLPGVLFCWLYGVPPGVECGGVDCGCWLELLEFGVFVLLEGCIWLGAWCGGCPDPLRGPGGEELGFDCEDAVGG